MSKAVVSAFFGVASCVLALVAGPAAAQGGKDRIQFKNGQQWLGVDVVKETYKGVEVADKPTKPHPTEIESITHGDRPATYLAAEQSYRQGQYDRAVKMFTEARKEQARPWLKYYCSYYLVCCRHKAAAESGKPEALAAAAAAEYEKLIKESPDGIKVPDAKFGIAECYYEARDLDKAATVLSEIAGSDYGNYWQLKAKLWLGKILLDQGKGAEAAKVFGEVQQEAAGKETMSEVYFSAALNRADGLIIAKPPQFEEARKLLEKTFAETKSDEIRAAVHNRMGDAYRAEKRIQEARMCYLRVVVLYADVPEERARALFFTADCFEQLKDIATARRFQNLLRQSYPDSAWRKRLSG